MATIDLDDLGSVFLRRDALNAGISQRQITLLTKSGDWHRVRRGAYVLGQVWARADEDDRRALRARAVLLQCRTEVVLSHTAALPEYGAPLWGVPDDVVHLTRLDSRAGRAEAGVRQHRGVLLPDDLVLRRGVGVTSGTRTAIDVPSVLEVEPALVVVNHLLNKGHTTLDEIRARYAPMRNNPHTLLNELVFRLADPRLESVGESRTWYVCWRHGVPMPVPQYRIVVQGRLVARLDFAWPDHRAWLEFDGKEKYLKHRRDGESLTDAVLREKHREDRVREITGWRCIRITWADLADPQRLARRIKGVLAELPQAS